MWSGSTALATGRVERRLAAILAADVAGYSRLMGADEEGTLARLKALRRELADPKIKEHRGRIVKRRETACSSSSPVSSMRCVAPSKCNARWRS
jgi:hypothetical protein